MEVVTPVVGVVTQLADVGARVPAGRALAIIEVMKMEHPLSVDVDVRVTAHGVAIGAEVAVGTAVVRVEPDDDVARQVPDESVPAGLDELTARHRLVTDAARPDAVARRHDAGSRTARENIDDLCDPDSFVEYGALAIAAQRTRRSLEELRTRTPADGLVTGIGRVDGRPVAIAAYDATVLAGTQGAVNHRKKDRLFSLAAERGLPVVLFAEGGGGRPGDTDVHGASFLDAPSFALFAALVGRVPTIAIVHGYCFAGNAALAGTAELVVATEGSNLGMAGPAMIEGAGLGVVTPDEIGTIDVQRANGVVDVVVPDEAAAVAVARHYLGLRTPGTIAAVAAHDQDELRTIIPPERRRVHDMRRLATVVADRDSVLELGRDHAPGMITMVGRVGGRAVGLLANDPTVRGGAVDAAGSDKAARLLTRCEESGLPVVVLADTPGFMVGVDVEHEGGVRAAGRLFVVAARLTVPVVAVVVRRAYGLGAMAMLGGHLQTPAATFAWPMAELGPMGLEGAVRLGFRRELDAVTDPEERAAREAALIELAHAHAAATNVASFAEIDDVIDPATTRARIIDVLAACAGGGWT